MSSLVKPSAHQQRDWELFPKVQCASLIICPKKTNNLSGKYFCPVDILCSNWNYYSPDKLPTVKQPAHGQSPEKGGNGTGYQGEKCLDDFL